MKAKPDYLKKHSQRRKNKKISQNSENLTENI